MAKAIYWQEGKSIDFVNSTNAIIEAGEIVVIGNHVGIAGTEIGIGETGTLVMEGVFKMPKGSEAIGAGEDVYFSAENGQITKTTTDTPTGYAVAAAGASDAEALVKLTGFVVAKTAAQGA